MCGITGIFAFNEIGRFNMIRLTEANNQLEHRGPDAGRLFSDYYVGLGHRRLSIIDLSTDAQQPMSDESKRYTIVFNGEIFNYKSIKKQLVKQGIVFKSQSDTEVLLQLYILKKEACLEDLVGFFAFAIYDAQEQSLFLARDRFGIKPLLYYMDDDKFVFSSEMKSITQYHLPLTLNKTAILTYFQLHYIPAPLSIYTQIKKLPPAHYLYVRKRDLQLKKYYQLPQQMASPPSYEQAQTTLRKLIQESVELRLISDVPLGAFLSGGIDSSVIVGVASQMQKGLHTFSIGYKDEPLFDETRYAELVAKKFGTQHHIFSLSNEDIFKAASEMLKFQGEPFADSSAIPFYLLSQKARQYVTVALSGDGGDETWAGYNKYAGEWLIRQNGTKVKLAKAMLGLLQKMPKSRNSFVSNKIRQMHRLGEAALLTAKDRYWYLSSFAKKEDVLTLFNHDFFEQADQEQFSQLKSELVKHIDGEGINDVLRSDVELVLTNDMLHKADQMSMASGLEVRVPLLDHRVVNFAFQLPTSYKISGLMKKKILQDAYKDLLPSELYNRPKQGFDVPLMKGYKTLLKDWITNDLLSDELLKEQNIWDLKVMQTWRKQILSSNDYDQNRAWAIIAFQYWWKYQKVKTLTPEEHAKLQD